MPSICRSAWNVMVCNWLFNSLPGVCTYTTAMFMTVVIYSCHKYVTLLSMCWSEHYCHYVPPIRKGSARGELQVIIVYFLFGLPRKMMRMVMPVMGQSMRALTTLWCSVMRRCRQLYRPWGRLDKTWRLGESVRRKKGHWFVNPLSLGRAKGASWNYWQKKRLSLRRGKNIVASSPSETAVGLGRRSGVCSKDASSATLSEYNCNICPLKFL